MFSELLNKSFCGRVNFSKILLKLLPYVTRSNSAKEFYLSVIPEKLFFLDAKFRLQHPPFTRKDNRLSIMFSIPNDKVFTRTLINDVEQSLSTKKVNSKVPFFSLIFIVP